jgi:OOP family OmpA-OmpF porin
MLADLSSSMRRVSPCARGLDKAEATAILMRKISQRISGIPAVASLRVFGHKSAWKEADFTESRYGPEPFDFAGLESAIAKLAPSDAVSPVGSGIRGLARDLSFMENPRVALVFSDFEVTAVAGDPAGETRKILETYGGDTRVFAFYVTRDKKAIELANQIALAGSGRSLDVCRLLSDETLFGDVMTDIFGPPAEPPCSDRDSDGVCDEADVCPLTPEGAPVDGRGCWMAAYSQFFDFDKAVVKSEFHPRLRHAAEIIKANPWISAVIIAGHTDSKGTDSYNMTLGQKRAEAVRELLSEFGAPLEKLAVLSFGKTKPLDTNDTEEGRSRNRRVEFHVGEIPPGLS